MNDALGRPVAKPPVVYDASFRPADRPAAPVPKIAAPANAGRPVAASRNNPARAVPQPAAVKAGAGSKEENVHLL
ncbi:MAG TPA: hypothetical protein VIU42_19470 [Xanthobacteraceae bacterium]|jgi:hypothetical protein